MADTDNRTQYSDDIIAANEPGGLPDNHNKLAFAYHDNNGRHKWTGGSSVASASSISVPDNENYFVVTGTTTITGIAATTSGASAIDTGVVIKIKFSGAPTLTHNGTSFIMPGGADASIAANDFAEFIHLGSGNWALLSRSAGGTGEGAGSYSNLILVTASTSTIDIDADSITLSDGANTFDATSVNLTADITASGANGLDTGSEANSTQYYAWVIYNGTTVASLLSTSATAPTMPSGYTYKRRVGSVYNDASGNFWTIYQAGNMVRVNQINVNLYLSAGTASTYTLLSPILPSTTRNIIVASSQEGSLSTFSFSVDGSVACSDISNGIVDGHTDRWLPVTTSQQHYYKRDSGTGNLHLFNIGWIDNL